MIFLGQGAFLQKLVFFDFLSFSIHFERICCCFGFVIGFANDLLTFIFDFAFFHFGWFLCFFDELCLNFLMYKCNFFLIFLEIFLRFGAWGLELGLGLGPLA